MGFDFFATGQTQRRIWRVVFNHTYSRADRNPSSFRPPHSRSAAKRGSLNFVILPVSSRDALALPRLSLSSAKQAIVPCWETRPLASLIRGLARSSAPEDLENPVYNDHKAIIFFAFARNFFASFSSSFCAMSAAI